jgi:hypothetical protein
MASADKPLVPYGIGVSACAQPEGARSGPPPPPLPRPLLFPSASKRPVSPACPATGDRFPGTAALPSDRLSRLGSDAGPSPRVVERQLEFGSSSLGGELRN